MGRRGNQLNMAAEAATIGLAAGDGTAVAATENKEMNYIFTNPRKLYFETVN